MTYHFPVPAMLCTFTSAMQDIINLYQLYLLNPVICTDTRAVTPNCLFFSLKGENFDGNQFAQRALDAGAAFAVIDDASFKKNDRYILVKDVLHTLQQLAKHHRKQLQIPVIGLTGSNGKTTTKELINAVLSQQFKTFATQGNLNNHIGVPLSLLSISTDVEIAIIEMGANHQKEIELLCSLAQPTHGLIANVGMAHLDGFGGFEGVKKGKAELYAHLKATNGVAFIHRDNPHLLAMQHHADLQHMVYYGTTANCYVKGRLIKSDPLLQLTWQNDTLAHTVTLQITGSYNFENALAAIAIGRFFGMDAQNINHGLANYEPKNNRSQLAKTNHNLVICDFYNANPSSISAAVENLASQSDEQKVAILGDMFELGQESAIQHQLIAETTLAKGFALSIFIGEQFFGTKVETPALFFKTAEEAKAFLTTSPIKGALVLLKGSRGMALEKLLPLL